MKGIEHGISLVLVYFDGFHGRYPVLKKDTYLCSAIQASGIRPVIKDPESLSGSHDLASAVPYPTTSISTDRIMDLENRHD